MLALTFTCDVCGDQWHDVLYGGYSMPNFKDFDLCLSCNLEAKRDLIAKKKLEK